VRPFFTHFTPRAGSHLIPKRDILIPRFVFAAQPEIERDNSNSKVYRPRLVFHLAVSNQVVRTPLNFISKRLHNFVASFCFLFAYPGPGKSLTVPFKSVLLGAVGASGETNLAARRSSFLEDEE
jgi:hypothetical protein